ncbi:MAG: RNA polymerase sigma factor [Vicinamibacterales bacterium]
MTVHAADLVSMLRPASPAASASQGGLGEESRETAQVRAWLDAARAGDREAFGALVGLHQSAVFRTALAALGDPAEAEDVAQEAFVVAWRKLGAFRGDATFRTWLLTITWRKALDRRRGWRLRRQRRVEPVAAEREDPIERLPVTDPDPERAAVAADLLRRVTACIHRLSPTLRDTLLLAASGEHTYDQIAALLGVPVGTVKWRVSEARRGDARSRRGPGS